MDETTRGVGGESNVDADVERQTREIRRDIEQTRGDMSETIEAIEEKLRPGHIVSSATERVKHAATERVRNMKQSAEQAYSRMRSGGTNGGVMEGIRQNPIPTAMIGIGAAWLLMQNRSKGHDDRRGNFDSISEVDAFGTGAVMEDDPQWDDEGASRRASYGSGGNGGNGGWLMEQIEHNPMPAAAAAVALGWFLTASRSQGSRASSSMGDSARRLTSRAQEYTHDVTADARERGRHVQSRLQRMASDNPLMVGAGALLLGSIVGLAIPETQRENEWLGEARDSMVDKAQELARTTAARAQETAADLAGEAATRIVGGE